MYYDIAVSGGDVDTLVAWNKDFTTRVAFGSLEAMTTTVDSSKDSAGP
jgi:hypothetical protein